jgi:hypothetical protein
VDVYLYPSFTAGNDQLIITVPGLDPFIIDIEVFAGPATKTQVILDEERVKPEEETHATIYVTDMWDNPVTNQTIDIELQTTGPLKMQTTNAQVNSKKVTVSNGKIDDISIITQQA